MLFFFYILNFIRLFLLIFIFLFSLISAFRSIRIYKVTFRFQLIKLIFISSFIIVSLILIFWFLIIVELTPHFWKLFKYTTLPFWNFIIRRLQLWLSIIHHIFCKILIWIWSSLWKQSSFWKLIFLNSYFLFDRLNAFASILINEISVFFKLSDLIFITNLIIFEDLSVFIFFIFLELIPHLS